MDKIVNAHGKPRIGAGQLNPASRALNMEFIVNWNGLHDGFNFMETILPAAQHIEQQVDFAVRFNNEAHATP